MLDQGLPPRGHPELGARVIRRPGGDILQLSD